MAAGWDFKESEDLTVCKDMQPWYDYCNEPPCGQVIPITNTYCRTQVQTLENTRHNTIHLIIG